MPAQVYLLSTRPLGKDWPAVKKWEVEGEDEIDGVELVDIRDPRQYALAHRATSGGKRWQVTTFDQDGPIGDSRRDSLAEALNYRTPPTEYRVTAVHLVADRQRANPEAFEELAMERWDDGTVIRFLAVPFAVGRKPFVTGGMARSARRGRVELATLIATQPRITDVGLAKHARGGGDLPIVYRTHDGVAYIADGHHRLAAAVRRGQRHADVMIVDVPKENPTMPEAKKAQSMFRRFHTRDWRGEGEFHPDLVIPDTVVCMGRAVHVCYRSDKLNPTDGRDEGELDYIHHHDPGVHVYRPERARGPGGEVVAVPAWLRNVDQLTWLGKCLEYRFKPDGAGEATAKGTDPLPELYTIPSGKALLVIQSKRTLVALIWGGRLGVERRGIVH